MPVDLQIGMLVYPGGQPPVTGGRLGTVGLTLPRGRLQM